MVLTAEKSIGTGGYRKKEHEAMTIGGR